MNNYNIAFNKYETLFLKDNKQPYILQDIYQNKDNNENLNIIYNKLCLIHKTLNNYKLINLMEAIYNKQFKLNDYENQYKKVIKFCTVYNEFIYNNKKQCLSFLNKSENINTKINIKNMIM